METHNDKAYKDKLSNTSVDFDLFDQWDDIESKLDKKENKRGVLFWWFGIFGVLIIAALGWISFSFDSSDAVDNDLVKNMPQEIAITPTQDSIATTDQDIMKDKTGQTPSSVNVESKLTNEQKALITSQSVSVHTKEYSTSKKSLFIETSQIRINSLRSKIIDRDAVIFSRFFENTVSADEYNGGPMTIFNESSNHQNDNTSQVGISNDLGNREIVFVSPISNITQIVIRSNFELDNEVSFEPKINIIQGDTQNWGLYFDFSFSKPNHIYNNVFSDTYADFLSDTYTPLTQVDLGLGLTYNISSKWNVGLGIEYRQNRSVHRGKVSQVSMFVETQDSASVFINNVAGTIYKPGEVTINSTLITDFQQYSYAHSLGIRLFAQLELPYSFYLSGQASYSIVQWQSGNLIDITNTLSPISEVLNYNYRPRFSVEFGYQLGLSRNTSIDLGVIYSRVSNVFEQSNFDVGVKSYGVRFGVIYQF